MTTTAQQLEATLRALQPLLARQFHVRRLGYFGSFATGQARPDSDVDVLVELAQPLGWEFFELEEMLENALQRRVDLVSIDALKAQLRTKILAETRYVE
ncbi:nucleotidyltransferase domain-containing protein [Hymenobacter sp. BRD128]|uniref:nucleotidyltransferase family protein n=1 Tax=Hymenobacter sp. BRD128 TaxID=2675878 RepID=UPI0015636003|nr:nucleotidyltransferase domain-containing protein [Hymenobacter sp. BRD128]QKG57297.1 nucleotidyltransferase domain-containing protein [Hymenobacter sp. BRD128]